MTKYPAKLLLFGEYSIIYGSKALATPLPNYYGSWQMNSGENSKEFNLWDVYKYLSVSGIKTLDLDRFKSDLENGLIFKSSIPVGYGVGSSGALCAGILDRYKDQELKELSNSQIQKELALIESCFHGKSSGLDPLVSFLNMQVLVDEHKEIQVLKDSDKPNPLNVYLIDSGKPRKTDTLVNAFTTKCLNTSYLSNLENEYIPLVNSCIDSWMNSQVSIKEKLLKLSFLQLSYFEEFIPPSIKSIWKESCATEEVSIKLCGAGGGGFFLLFSDKNLNYYLGNELIKVFEN